MRENLHTPDKAVLKEKRWQQISLSKTREKERTSPPSPPPPKKLSTFHAHKTGAQDN